MKKISVKGDQTLTISDTTTRQAEPITEDSDFVYSYL